MEVPLDELNGATYLTIPYKSWHEHSLQKHNQNNKSIQHSLVPKIPKSILLRLPGSNQYCEVLKKKVWVHETSIDFVKLDSRVDFVLIGDVSFDSVYFWLCICGSQDETLQYHYTLTFDIRDYYVENGISYYKMRESVRTLDENLGKHFASTSNRFSVNLDTAKRMKKDGRGIELTIFKTKKTESRKFKIK